MNKLIATLACMLATASVAAAQERDRDPRHEDLRRQFERSMKELDKKFHQERERLEQAFRRAMEKVGGHPEKKKDGEKHRGPERKQAEKKRQPKKDAEPREKKKSGDHRERAEEHRRRSEEHRERADEEFGERLRRAIPPDFAPKFKELLEKFGGRDEGPGPRRDEQRESLDKVLERIQERLHDLEKRLEGFRGDMPRFRELERFMPRDFKFDFLKPGGRDRDRDREEEPKGDRDRKDTDRRHDRKSDSGNF